MLNKGSAMINSNVFYRLAIRIIGVGLFLQLGAALLTAQDKHSQQNLHTGIPYAISDIENINLTNGNLMFNFNFGTVRGRGSVAMPFALKYNSKLYDTYVMTTPDTSGNNSPQKFLRPTYESGWQYDGGYQLRVINRNDDQDEPLQISDSCGRPNYKAVFVWKLIMYFPDGSQHEFRPTGYSDIHQSIYGLFQTGDGYFNVATNGQVSDLSYGCIGPTSNCSETCTTRRVTYQDPNSKMTYYSTDGTFMRLEIPNGQDIRYPTNWTLFMPDGSKVTNGELDGQGNPLPQRVYDKNGNYVQRLDFGDNGWIDEFGRKIERVAVSQLEDHIVRSGVRGETVVWKVRWKYITVIKKYTTSSANEGRERCCYSQQVLVSQPKVVDEIELPLQLGGGKFIFNYNGHEGQVPWNLSVQNPNESPGWGDLVSVTLPSGAKAEYDYVSGPLLFTDQLLPQLGKVREKRLIYESFYDGISQQVTDVWKYTINQSGNSTVTAPDGQVSTLNFYSTDVDSDLSGRVYREISPDRVITERIWANNKVGGCPQYGCGSMRRLNTYVKTEFTTFPDANGNPQLTSIKDFDYDKNGNITKITEYDWVPYSTLPRNAQGAVSDIPVGATVSRITESVFYNQTEDASDSTANNPASYWNSTAPEVRNAVASTEVKNGFGTALSRTEIEYDNPSTTANPTTTRMWDSYKGGHFRAYSNPLTSVNSISTSASYNQHGMPLTTTDANGVITQFTYGAVQGPNGPVFDLYPTQTITAYGTSVARTSAAVYDFYTGLVTTATDVDNNVSTVTEYDALGRPTKVRNAAGTPLESWTRTEYDDVNRRVVVRSDIDSMGDGRKVSVQHFDQLGRVRLTRTLEDPLTEDPYNERHGIKVETRYKTVDGYTYQLVSNPFRAATSSQAANEPTMGWTLSTAWSNGRRSEVETFSGAALPVAFGGNNTNSTGIVRTDIEANATTVTDQAGKQRRSITNSLRQLIRVDEPDANGNLGSIESPLQPTFYSYDVLGNLIRVEQGVQTRMFVYDSLSRLVSATNPESGTISYRYDPNGNLTQKTDARGVVTNYTYDALNRVTMRSYSGEAGYTTPSVTYTYDNLPNAKGKLTKVSSSISTTEYTAFDIIGRVTASKQVTDGVSYETGYVYNLAGAVVEETYPSGRKVKNTLDASGDLSMVQSGKCLDAALGTNAACINAAGLWSYARHFSYNAAGAVTGLQLGNGLWESAQFNSRLQPTQIALGATQGATNLLKLDYDYGTTANNGNVLSQTITVPTVGESSGFVAVQTYNYDSLNRLKQAAEMVTPTGGSPTLSWKQAFTFDRYGNRNFDEANTTTLPRDCVEAGNPVVCESVRPVVNPSVNPLNNRFSSGQGWSYDAAGNTTADPQGRTFTYDAENKQVKVESFDANGSPINTLGVYYYDGDGKRVKKVVPATGETTIFVYDASGRLVAEYSTVVANSADAKVAYLTADHLGSPRINTDANGNVTARHDYHPFGEAIGTLAAVHGSPQPRTATLGYTTDTVRKQFTGYERDKEINLDFAQARYYSSRLGKFYSVDPANAGADEEYPQSWNGYAYGGNNPILFVDPDGREYLLCDKDRKNCVTQTDDIVKGAQRKLRGSFQETGRDGHFDMGNVLDENGNVIGTYERISIDREYQFFYSIAENSIKKAKVVGVLAGAAVVTGACIGTGICAAMGTAIASRVGPRIGAQAVEMAIERIMGNPNILNKIFAEKHLLQPLVQQLGSQRAVVTAVIEAVATKLPSTDGVYRISVTVADKTVQVQVYINNGAFKVNDFWIPR